MSRPASDARDRALAAALVIVRREGAASLTLDAVAKEASLSKGGLLHHFPSKDALVLALVDRLVVDFDAAVAMLADTDPNPVGRYVRAFMTALTSPELAQVGRALLAAVALNTALLEPMRVFFKRCQQRVESDGLDHTVAYQCVLVADAIWYAAVFDLPGPPRETVERVLATLVAQTRVPAKPVV